MTLPSLRDHDPLNAFVERVERGVDERRVPHAGAEGPLAGARVAIKDCFFHRGRTPTMGSRVGPAPGAGPAQAIERIEAAGGVVAGYTNMHEWAVGGTSAVTATGPVRNPWDRDLVAGGSSGGSAAAVAAGMVDAAVGTDAGGSIRIPAACCGVVGYKPSFGLVPTTGYVCDGGPTDHVGAVAGNTRRAAALVSVMARTTVIEEVDTRALRVGVATGGIVDDVAPEVAREVEAAVGSLGGIVAEIVAVDAGDLDGAARANGRVFLSWTAGVVGSKLDDEAAYFDPTTYELLDRARGFGRDGIARAASERRRWQQRWADLFTVVDVLVTPTLPVLAPPITAAEVTLPSGPREVNSALGSLNGAMNLSGAPCVSLPCGEAGSLTVNMSLTAAPGRDATAIALGVAFEDATERRWVDRVAPL